MTLVKQFVPREFCLKCLGCCRFSQADSAWLPCLLDEEMLELADRQGIPAVSLSVSKRIIPVPLKDKESFVCPLLNVGNNKCRIYDFRPFECRLYPFLISMRDKKILLTIDLNCPYIKERINSKEFKEYTEYLVNFLNSAKQLKILKDNPQVLQAYEEAIDVMELKSLE
jgi:Fe-S-cluster containining protein